MPPQEPAAPTTIAEDLETLLRLARTMRAQTRRLERQQDAFWRACRARAAASRQETRDREAQDREAQRGEIPGGKAAAAPP